MPGRPVRKEPEAIGGLVCRTARVEAVQRRIDQQFGRAVSGVEKQNVRQRIEGYDLIVRQHAEIKGRHARRSMRKKSD